MADTPHRRHTLTIKLGADDWESVLHAIREIETALYEARDKGGLLNSVCGGPSLGWVIEHQVDESMTHERYHAELDAWLAERRKGEGSR